MQRNPHIQEFIKRIESDPIIQAEIENTQHEARKVKDGWKFRFPEKFKESKKKYEGTEKGKEALRRKSLKRRSLEISSKEGLSLEEKKKIQQFYISCPQGYHVDHIIPLARGGLHRLDNLQYLLPTENAKKGVKISTDIPPDILAKCFRLRYKHKITIPFLIRRFHISNKMATDIKNRIDAYDSNNPPWYPGKPFEENKEDLETFLKRITPKRSETLP